MIDDQCVMNLKYTLHTWVGSNPWTKANNNNTYHLNLALLHQIDWGTVELAHSQFAVVALSNQGLGICKQIGQLVNKLVKLGILACNKMSDVPATE